MPRPFSSHGDERISVLLIPADPGRQIHRERMDPVVLACHARTIVYQLQPEVVGCALELMSSQRNHRATRLLATSLEPGDALHGDVVIVMFSSTTTGYRGLPAGFEAAIDVTSPLRPPERCRHLAPLEVTYEWTVKDADRYERHLAVLTVSFHGADLDIDVGRRVPDRYEAQLTKQQCVRSPVKRVVAGDIPFSGLRICWQGAPRFSNTGLDRFATTALRRLAVLYEIGDTHVFPYFAVSS
jgi:hypothetical protein